jgi:arabinose-5-phosphate isomerase
MYARGFTSEDFARYHPGGQLGRNLHLRVEDVMHRGEKVAWVAADDSLKEVVISMTQRPLGAACVVDEQYGLLGLITDGDLRRALLKHDDIRFLHARDIMTARPVTVRVSASLREALRLMEDRPSQISVLPVTDEAGHSCVGLIRIHDIYQEDR